LVSDLLSPLYRRNRAISAKSTVSEFLWQTKSRVGDQRTERDEGHEETFKTRSASLNPGTLAMFAAEKLVISTNPYELGSQLVSSSGFLPVHLL